MNTEYFKAMVSRIHLNNPHTCNAESIPGLIVQSLSMGNGEIKLMLEIQGSYSSPRIFACATAVKWEKYAKFI